MMYGIWEKQKKKKCTICNEFLEVYVVDIYVKAERCPSCKCEKVFQDEQHREPTMLSNYK